MKKFNHSSLFCYLYILLLVISYFSFNSLPFIKSCIIATSTCLAVSILWDLKNLLNKKCAITNLNFFINCFILIKIFVGMFSIFNISNIHILFDNFRLLLFFSTLLQLVYGISIIKSNFKKFKFFKFYGYILCISSIFALILPNSSIHIFFPIITAFILGEIFFEGENLV